MKDLYLLLESISTLGCFIAFLRGEPTTEILFAMLTFLFFCAYWVDKTREEKK